MIGRDAVVVVDAVGGPGGFPPTVQHVLEDSLYLHQAGLTAETVSLGQFHDGVFVEPLQIDRDLAALFGVKSVVQFVDDRLHFGDCLPAFHHFASAKVELRGGHVLQRLLVQDLDEACWCRGEHSALDVFAIGSDEVSHCVCFVDDPGLRLRAFVPSAPEITRKLTGAQAQ